MKGCRLEEDKNYTISFQVFKSVDGGSVHTEFTLLFTVDCEPEFQLDFSCTRALLSVRGARSVNNGRPLHPGHTYVKD